MIHDSRFKDKFIFIVFFLLLTAYNLLLPSFAWAVCPICTVAVGAGLGISRMLGIDDTVTSVWIGGLILSMSFWLVDWFNKRKFSFVKKINSGYLDLVVTTLMYTLVLVPLWYSKYIGRETNMIFGIDKIIFGTILGSFAFLGSKELDKKVRKKKGRQLFLYQKVVFPVASLLIISLILHFFIK